MFEAENRCNSFGNKILIVGCSGSGKSTFAVKLQKLLRLPLYHLDNIYWRKDRSHLSREEFDSKVRQILSKEQWIMDGNYTRTYELRIQACDTVIFLDYSRDVCMNGIIERVGKAHPDLPWTEEALDQELVDNVNRFETVKRPRLLELMQKYPEKQWIVFRNRKQADEWLRIMETGE